LGTQTGLQAALANLDAASQANVQNLAAQLQTQGLNANQALQAALANQQAQLTTGQQNLGAALQTQQLGTQTGLQALLANQQSDLEAQRAAEASRQFGANLGMQGLAQAGQMGQTLTNIGSAQQQADAQRLGLQSSAAAQQQALEQQKYDMAYQDFVRQRDYPLEMLQQYSSLLRGVPVTPSSTTTTYAPTPGVAQQLLGTGLSAASIYNTFGRG
jgi:ParB-like chromosome segregation protein Spo0J